MTKPYTAEYGTIPENEMSKETVLASGKGAFGRPYELLHKTGGYEIAGSCLRLTNEAWGSISYDRNGATHGKWFKTLPEAEENFLRLTTAIIEIRAEG